MFQNRETLRYTVLLLNTIARKVGTYGCTSIYSNASRRKAELNTLEANFVRGRTCRGTHVSRVYLNMYINTYTQDCSLGELMYQGQHTRRIGTRACKHVCISLISGYMYAYQTISLTLFVHLFSHLARLVGQRASATNPSI